MSQKMTGSALSFDPFSPHKLSIVPQGDRLVLSYSNLALSSYNQKKKKEKRRCKI